MAEWRLPGPERHAARSARDVERQKHRNEQLAAELEAERNKAGKWYNAGAPPGI